MQERTERTRHTEQVQVEDDLEVRLELIGRATVAIAAERSLPRLLQRIVDTAREVTRAQYGALGVAGDAGDLTEFITSGISAEQRAALGRPPRGHGLLGVILRNTEPVRIREIGADPRSHGFPPDHPPMRSFLGAPILLGGRNLGNLYLTNKLGAPVFSEEDERLLVVLAAHAAIAIDSAHLYAQTNEALAQRVRELGVANRQLQRLTSKVIDAQEEERRRIARDLHDDTAQALASIQVRLRLLSRQAEAGPLREEILSVLEETAGAVDGVRRLAMDLRPSTLDDLGLGPAVESQAREFGDRTDIPVRTRLTLPPGRLPRNHELVIYRVIQEALTNIAKHARATLVEVELRAEGEQLIATVRDNGRGFRPDEVAAARGRGLGIFGMQERAQLAGGYLDVRSKPAEGTTVTLVAPLHPEGTE